MQLFDHPISSLTSAHLLQVQRLQKYEVKVTERNIREKQPLTAAVGLAIQVHTCSTAPLVALDVAAPQADGTLAALDYQPLFLAHSTQISIRSLHPNNFARDEPVLHFDGLLKFLPTSLLWRSTRFP